VNGGEIVVSRRTARSLDQSEQRKKEKHVNTNPSEPLYCLAARFASKAKAGTVYAPLEQLIFAAKNDCDLSVYRFQITEGWHVVVLGEKPAADLQQRIEALLAQGTLVNLYSLRPDVIADLQERRARASTIAPWVEIHHDIPEE